MLKLLTVIPEELRLKRDYDQQTRDRIISCIKRYGPISRHDISSYLRIGYRTVEKYVSEMIVQGCVQDIEGNLDGIIGRPPRVLVLRNN